VAAVVVAMAWSVHSRQIRLAEQLARRQFIVIAGTQPAASTANADGLPANGQVGDEGRAHPRSAVVIDGPGTLVAGEQARYRVRPAGGHKVVSWAAGGGPVSHAPDPAHPDELLLVADQPGSLTISVRVRDGMTERRATKSVTVVADVMEAAPPFPLRLFLRGWGLVAVAVLIIGFAGALDALGDLASGDFIALAALLAALLGVLTGARGGDEARPAKTAKAQAIQALNGRAEGTPGHAVHPAAGKPDHL
jgi:hypothetical protein